MEGKCFKKRKGKKEMENKGNEGEKNTGKGKMNTIKIAKEFQVSKNTLESSLWLHLSAPAYAPWGTYS